MHDPMTVAHEIKRPWRNKPDKFWPKGYRPTMITIWHVDPEKGGSDDSCGWFVRARHCDQAKRDEVRRAFAFEWSHGVPFGWFNSNGDPNFSTQGVVLGMFSRAARIHFGHKDRRYNRFMRRHLAEILLFAENNVDSLYAGINQHYGREKSLEDRVNQTADSVYAWIVRKTRPWYKHPRWHILHWKIQVHASQNFKRWAFSRCAKCGKGFAWGYSPTTTSWDGDGPRWFRSERNTYHAECCPGHGVSTGVAA